MKCNKILFSIILILQLSHNLVAQDKNSWFFGKAIEKFLMDSVNVGLYNIDGEYKQFNNVIIAMSNLQNNMPENIAGFNTVYIDKCEVCDYLIDKNSNRLVLLVSPIRLNDSLNSMSINVTSYYIELSKRTCKWKIFAGGGFLKDNSIIRLFFNCSKGVWELE